MLPNKLMKLQGQSTSPGEEGSALLHSAVQLLGLPTAPPGSIWGCSAWLCLQGSVLCRELLLCLPAVKTQTAVSGSPLFQMNKAVQTARQTLPQKTGYSCSHQEAPSFSNTMLSPTSHRQSFKGILFGGRSMEVCALPVLSNVP